MRSFSDRWHAHVLNRRRDCGAVEVFRDPQGELFVDDDVLGIAGEGGSPGIGLGRAVSLDLSRGKLLVARAAVRTAQIRIDHAAHAREIAGFEFGNLRPGRRDPANDLMTQHGQILAEAPFVACEVDVRVANATVENLDFDIQIGWLPAGNSGGSERCGRGFGGVGFDGYDAGWLMVS